MRDPGEHRAVEGFPDYEITPSGQVYSLSSRKYNKLIKTNNGSYSVGLVSDGVQHKRGLAKLVAQTYLEQPTDDWFNTPMHKNGDREDCSAKNLCWRPRWFAIKCHSEWLEVDTQFSRLEEVENLVTGETGTIEHFASKYGESLSDIWKSTIEFELDQVREVFPHRHRYKSVKR